jgi:mannan endo-1,6-alpha-mannosidase
MVLFQSYLTRLIDSIRQAAATVAKGMLSYYHNNENNDAAQIGLLKNPPYYWWESGAMWGAMLDYWKYTV